MTCKKRGKTDNEEEKACTVKERRKKLINLFRQKHKI